MSSPRAAPKTSLLHLHPPGNVCVNGTREGGNHSCVDGVYWCKCGFPLHQCGPAVGMENVTEAHGHDCARHDPDYRCWATKVAAKFPGLANPHNPNSQSSFPWTQPDANNATAATAAVGGDTHQQLVYEGNCT